MSIKKIVKPLLITFAVIIGLGLIAKVSRSNNPDLLLEKGIESLRVGDYYQALEFCAQVTVKKREELQAWKCKAEAALFAGEAQIAREAYESILQIEPGNVEAILGIGDTYIKSGELLLASEKYGEFLESYSETDIEEGFTLIEDTGKFSPIRQGFILFFSGDLPASLEMFEEITSINPNLPSPWWGRGLALISINPENSTSAIVSFDKAVEVSDSKFYPALVSKGATLSQAKESEQALNVCEQALAINPEYIDGKLCVAAALFELGRYDKALVSTENIIQGNPKNYQAWTVKQAILVKLKRYDQALEASEETIAINPEDPLGYSNQADALYYLQSYDKALASVDQSIELSQKYDLPISNDTWFIRGNVLTALEEYEEALYSYQEALTIKEDFPAAWNAAARVLEKINRNDLAIEAYQMAVEYDENYYYAFEGMGNVYLKDRDYEQAIEAYNQAINIVQELPKDIRIGYPLHGVLNSKGKALHAIQDYQGAINAYQQALEIKPDFAAASFNLGITFDELKLYELAIPAFDQALKSSPNWKAAENKRSMAQKSLDNAPILGIVMDQNNQNNEILVKQVTSNSPAAREGIKVNDIIREIDGFPTRSIYDVQRYVRSGRIGSSMEIKIERDGKTQYFRVRREKQS